MGTFNKVYKCLIIKELKIREILLVTRLQFTVVFASGAVVNFFRENIILYVNLKCFNIINKHFLFP